MLYDEAGQRMTDLSGIPTAPWEEPEFEFDDIGIDLAASARQNSSKLHCAQWLSAWKRDDHQLYYCLETNSQSKK